jgi:hypothetical protein
MVSITISTSTKSYQEKKLSPLFEIARVLVRFDHIARVIVNADHSITRPTVKLRVANCSADRHSARRTTARRKASRLRLPFPTGGFHAPRTLFQ